MHSVRISKPKNKEPVYILVYLLLLVVAACYGASFSWEPLPNPNTVSFDVTSSCTRTLAENEYRLKKDDWRYLFLMSGRSCYMICTDDSYYALNYKNEKQRRDKGCLAWNNPSQNEGYITLRGIEECTIARITRVTCP